MSIHPLAGLLSLLAVLACCRAPESQHPAPPVSTGPVAAAPPAPLMEAAPLQRTPDDEEPLAPVPSVEEVAESLELDVSGERVALGRQLFHDPRLSKDLTVSCASCHDLRFGGVDRTPKAIGIAGQVGPVNTPTVFNAALGIAQFWDGRAKDLATQAGGPPEAPGEMGSNFHEITTRLRADAGVVAAFRAAFPDEVRGADDITTDRILTAIASFEATLVTPGSRFDQWLDGNTEVLTEEELRGYALFKSVGCAQCHYGPAVGGKTFQKLGQKKDFFSSRQLSHADHGRFNVTKDERDRHAFKVPSLRNVEATAPYLHDGSVATLEETVRVMGTYQLGVELQAEQVRAIVAFLRTLTGTFEGRPVHGAPR
jgi:cytochrome c peroxidase